VASAERSLLDEKASFEKECSETHRKRDVLEVEANGLDKDLHQPITENCPTCGQKWPPNKFNEFMQKRAEKEQKLKEFQQKIFDIDKKLIEQQKQLQEFNKKLSSLEWPKAPDLPSFDNTRIDAFVVKITNIDESLLRKELEKAKDGEIRIEEGTKRFKLIEE
jgi:DNA repair exonuclease SbcCD ATPase subunit